MKDRLLFFKDLPFSLVWKTPKIILIPLIFTHQNNILPS